MPITGLPTFTSGILTASQLNAIVSALEEKFAGKLTTGDFSWPFTAGGNIDMAQYNILNLGKFWNAYDASARAAGTTLQSVLDAVSSDGGGLVLVPGNTTEYIPATGLSVPASVILAGDGESSALSIHASASAAMVTLGANADNTQLRDLRLIGNASVNQVLLRCTSSDNVRLTNLSFDTHGTSALFQVDTGSRNVLVQHCRFTGMGDASVNNMISVTGSVGLRILDNEFRNWSNRTISIIPAAADPVSGTIISRNRMYRDTATAANMTAAAAVTFDNANTAACQGLIFTDNIIGGGGAGINGLEVDGDTLEGVILSNNEIRVNGTEPALRVADGTHTVTINDNVITTTQSDGIVIGADNGTEASASASVVRGLAMSNNNVYANHPTAGQGNACIIAVAETTNGLRGAVTGNTFYSVNSHAVSIWNVGTTRPLYLTFAGNTCISENSAYKGFASMRLASNGTNNGDIGTAAISHYFVMVGNIILRAAAGTDYTHSAANKAIIQDNVA